MSKLKRANCVDCGRAIGRHDPKRVETKIKVLTRPGYKTITEHLACSQEKAR